MNHNPPVEQAMLLRSRLITTILSGLLATLICAYAHAQEVSDRKPSETQTPRANLLTSTALALTQESTRTKPERQSSDRYAELYDVIFPHQPLELGREQFVLTLRYSLTTRSRDFQYSILRYDDGRMKVVALRTQQSPFYYLDLEYPITAISAAEFEAAKEMVKSIPIERREFELKPDEAKRLVEGLTGALPPHFKNLNSIFFDGTHYNLWLNAATYDLTYVLSGEPLGAKSFSNPMVRWMNQAHEVLSLAAWGSTNTAQIMNGSRNPSLQSKIKR